MELELMTEDSNPPFDDGFTDSDNLITSSEFKCEVCGIPLTYGGRGRKPKFCDDHKRKATTTPRTSGKSIDTLIGQMTDLYIGAAALMQTLPPTVTDGMILASRASALAESWRPLMERDPKVKKFWEKVCTGGGWGSVIAAHAMLALSIMQSHNVQLPIPFMNKDAA